MNKTRRMREKKITIMNKNYVAVADKPIDCGSVYLLTAK